jgi:hypothetical protein
MSTKRRLWIGCLCSLILALAIAAPASAGGWTNVTLDFLPTNLQAGQHLSLGFMVRQHGVTPISNVTPTLKARNAATGETLSAVAHQEGSVGHFVVDVTFPSAGSWQWSVTPAPFPEVELGGVSILPAGVAAPQQASQGSPATEGRGLSFDTLASVRPTLRWAGGLALLLALALGVWSQRATFVRWRPLRAR